MVDDDDAIAEEIKVYRISVLVFIKIKIRNNEAGQQNCNE